jgi:excisionase family DNA binding protein
MVAPSRLRCSSVVAHLKHLDADAVTSLSERAVAGGIPLAGVATLLFDAWRQVEGARLAGKIDASTTEAAAAITRRAVLGAAATLDPRRQAKGPAALVVATGSMTGRLGADLLGALLGSSGRSVRVLNSPGGLDRHLGAGDLASVVLVLDGTADMGRAAGMVRAAHRASVPVVAWAAATQVDVPVSAHEAATVGADAWTVALDGVVSMVIAAEQGEIVVNAAGASGGADIEPSSAEATRGVGTGQVFADILLLAALSCQAACAVVSVPRAGGQWSTLSYGFERRVGLDDPRFFELVASSNGPLEVARLASAPELADSPLTLPPHELRWAYGAALRNPSGALLGVVAVLDRRAREVGRRERPALLAVARQMTNHLAQLRHGPVSVATSWPATRREGQDAATGAAVVGRSSAAIARRSAPPSDGHQLLRSHEVAMLFDVTERTVINWASAGKLPSLRTMGGHLRFRSEDVLDLLAGRSSPSRSTDTGS